MTGTEGGSGRARPGSAFPTWKLPSDMWAYQELLAETRPELIVETGTQYGGSALFYASVFDLLGAGEVVTVDIDTSAGASRPCAGTPAYVTVDRGELDGPRRWWTQVRTARARAGGRW